MPRWRPKRLLQLGSYFEDIRVYRRLPWGSALGAKRLMSLSV
jgi:hypothetical protein